MNMRTLFERIGNDAPFVNADFSMVNGLVRQCLHLYPRAETSSDIEQTSHRSLCLLPLVPQD